MLFSGRVEKGNKHQRAFLDENNELAGCQLRIVLHRLPSSQWESEMDPWNSAAQLAVEIVWLFGNRKSQHMFEITEGKSRLIDLRY